MNLVNAEITEVDISLEKHGFVIFRLECEHNGEIKRFSRCGVDQEFLRDFFLSCGATSLSDCMSRQVVFTHQDSQIMEFLYPMWSLELRVNAYGTKKND